MALLINPQLCWSPPWLRFPSSTPLILEPGDASVAVKEVPSPALYLWLEKRGQKEAQEPTQQRPSSLPEPPYRDSRTVAKQKSLEISIGKWEPSLWSALPRTDHWFQFNRIPSSCFIPYLRCHFSSSSNRQGQGTKSRARTHPGWEKGDVISHYGSRHYTYLYLQRASWN